MSRLPVLVILYVLWGGSCGYHGKVEDIEPGERPAAETDEAGIWMQMDRVEEQIRTSGRVVKAPALQEYVRSIVHRLAPEFREDIRVYIMRAPDFNAMMAPNGAMFVFTGLLLRVQNEAQLAYVLGHELVHYFRRHSVQRWRDMRARTGSLAFVQLGSAAAGLYSIGDIATLVALGRIFAFSRENEREADDGGLVLMAEAGYDPREAAKVWQSLIHEREAGDIKEPPIFYATHPSTKERVATLRALAHKAARNKGDLGRERFQEVTQSLRRGWLRDELRHRRFERTEAVLDRLLRGGHARGEISYFRGELYRLRGQDGDVERATAAYEEARQHGGAPPELHRSLGQVYWSKGMHAKARKAFRAYLAQEPAAKDRAMVESYIKQLGGER